MKQKVARNQILRFIHVWHITTNYTLCSWQVVRSYPPRVTEHNFLIFAHSGWADPKKYFLHLFGHKKLGKVMKFQGHNPSSFSIINIFMVGWVESYSPRVRYGYIGKILNKSSKFSKMAPSHPKIQKPCYRLPLGLKSCNRPRPLKGVKTPLYLVLGRSKGLGRGFMHLCYQLHCVQSIVRYDACIGCKIQP